MDTGASQGLEPGVHAAREQSDLGQPHPQRVSELARVCRGVQEEILRGGAASTTTRAEEARSQMWGRTCSCRSRSCRRARANRTLPVPCCGMTRCNLIRPAAIVGWVCCRAGAHGLAGRTGEHGCGMLELVGMVVQLSNFGRPGVPPVVVIVVIVVIVVVVAVFWSAAHVLSNDQGELLHSQFLWQRLRRVADHVRSGRVSGPRSPG